MDFKFSKDTGDNPQQAASGDKGRQNILLIVLLILVAGLGYVYFFTGLIKPQEPQKPAETPPPEVVKKALPPREGEAPKAAAPAVPDVQKGQAVPPKPESAKVAQTAPTAAPAVKEAPKPKEEPKKPEPAKAAEKKPLPAVPEKKEQKPAPGKGEAKKQMPGKPVAVEKKGGSAVVAEKKAAGVKKPPVKQQKRPAIEPVEGGRGRWTVVVGNYLLEDAMATDLIRVRKAGLEASVQMGGRKKSTMNRLFLGEYADKNIAKAELEKLKKHTSDAFIIEHNGKQAVYAGSYLLDARAASEKERLAADGFTLAVKRAEVAIPSRLLAAGTFSDKKEAEAVLKKLKDAGLKGALIRQ